MADQREVYQRGLAAIAAAVREDVDGLHVMVDDLDAADARDMVFCFASLLGFYVRKVTTALGADRDEVMEILRGMVIDAAAGSSE